MIISDTTDTDLLLNAFRYTIYPLFLGSVLVLLNRCDLYLPNRSSTIVELHHWVPIKLFKYIVRSTSRFALGSLIFYIFINDVHN